MRSANSIGTTNTKHTFRIISDNPNDTLYPITDLDLREMQDYEFEIYGRYLWDCSIKL